MRADSICAIDVAVAPVTIQKVLPSFLVGSLTYRITTSLQHQHAACGASGLGKCIGESILASLLDGHGWAHNH